MRIYKLELNHRHYGECTVYKLTDIPGQPCLEVTDAEPLPGHPVLRPWRCRKVIGDKDLPIGDITFSSFSSMLVLSKHAIEVLTSVLGDMEVLAVKTNLGDYAIVNVLSVLDCVDYERSDYKCFSETTPGELPNIMCFYQYEFRKEIIGDHHIFRTPDRRCTNIFVDYTFVQEVQRNNLTGFSFLPVWTDEGSLEDIVIHTEEDMSDADFAHIEEALEIRLPEQYKKTLRINELARCGFGKHIMHDPEQVIKVNQRSRREGIYGIPLKPEHFVICYQPRTTVYRYLDLSNPNSPVYMINRRKGLEYAPDDPEKNRECDSLERYVTSYCWAVRAVSRMI